MKQHTKTAPAERWETQMRFDCGFVERTLRARGELAAMFVVHGEQDAVTLLATQLSTEDKHLVYSFIALVACAHCAEAVTMMAEGWMRTVPVLPGESQAAHSARAHAVPLSEAEDRIEVVNVALTYRDAAGQRRARLRVGEILRDAQGVSGLRWLDDADGLDAVSGQVVDILTEFPPEREQVLAARALLAEAGPRLMKALGIYEGKP